MTEIKVCNRCELPKPIADFYDRNRVCKACIIKRQNARMKAKPLSAEQRSVKAQKYHLKKKYDMTLEDYESMLASQGGVCAICKRPPSGRFRLSVDHCHVTGKVRGLLCHPCNGGLGCFQDDTDRIEKAIAYLGGA